MKIVKHKNYYSNNRLICLILFTIESAVIIACYFIETSGWNHSANTPSLELKLIIGLSLLIILISSLFVCLFFRRLSIDKKILIMLGFIAIALGIIGTSGLVIKKDISFIDAVYKTFQLFVGEFGDLEFETGSFPVMLNISRFLALFVTFGTIIVILLKEKISRLGIWLFYRDTVIITDNISSGIASLVESLIDKNHKVTIGLISAEQSIEIEQDDIVPIVSFNLDNDLKRGLNYCNIKNTKCIYILSDKTVDNIIIHKEICSLFENNTKKEYIINNPNPVDSDENQSIENLYSRLRSLLKTSNIIQPGNPKKISKGKKICYIQYKNWSEKNFYSLDDSFTKRPDCLETYFINPAGAALRQMISQISLNRLLTPLKNKTSEQIISDMKNLKIAVSGSGPLLYQAVAEISRLCVFNDTIPFEIKYLHNKTQAQKLKNILSYISDSVPSEFMVTDMNISIDSENIPQVLFICSYDEIEIRSILHALFQYNYKSKIREIFILTETNKTGFDILKKYIKTLSAEDTRVNDKSDCNLTIQISNLSDLSLTIDDFYRTFGPTTHEIHEAYRKAMSDGILKDFNKLPELFVDSNLLNTIHNCIFLNFLINLNKAGCEISNNLLDFISATEHERWFNERKMQGFIYSEKQNYLFNTNSNLKHWAELDELKKQNNIRYVLNSMIIQQKRKMISPEKFIPNITKETFNR